MQWVVYPENFIYFCALFKRSLKYAQSKTFKGQSVTDYLCL